MVKKNLKNILLITLASVGILGGGYLVTKDSFKQGYIQGAYDMQKYWAEKSPETHNKLYNSFKYSGQEKVRLDVLRNLTPLEQAIYDYQK
ncbi:MAG: hypothetical protein PHX15_02585 [Candidatus Nanoarchaeia archaeon]|jgi:hypothetical protein|nr:hypothetical protein [Candidatus Nanoarchaeia archaeon]MDD3994056.1 hypothetical protein [Candidatus Nanoarchaeia archaeon]MDD4563328.1 hypothetical protein [Candidatus Nanoarchaeia archaeon]MDY0016152.1 hypothetical protein [Bacteroidales bacterium]